MTNFVYTWLPSTGAYVEAWHLFIKSFLLWKMNDIQLIVLCGSSEVSKEICSMTKNLDLFVETVCVTNASLEHVSIWQDYVLPEGANILYLDCKTLCCGPVDCIFRERRDDLLYGKKEGNTRFEYWGRNLFQESNPETDAFMMDILLCQNSPTMRRLFSKVMDQVKEGDSLRKSLIYHAIKENVVDVNMFESRVFCNPPYLTKGLWIASFPRIRGTTTVEVKRMRAFFRDSLLGEDGLLNYQSIARQMKETEMDMERFDKIVADNQSHFDVINKICIDSGEPVEGNCFFQHCQMGKVVETKWKQLNLYWMARFSKNIMEIGFNAGHSCLLFLLANPESKITLFDLCEHRYTRSCFEYLDNAFPNRLTLIPGNSNKTVPEYTATFGYETFDLVHVDGGHLEIVADCDFRNILPLASRIIILDDTNFDHLNTLFCSYLKSGYLEEIFAKDTSNGALRSNVTLSTYIPEKNDSGKKQEHRLGTRSLAGRSYFWGKEKIHFLPEGKLRAFGDGHYVLLNHHIVYASFGSHEHFLKFDKDFTKYIALRKHDFLFIRGEEAVEEKMTSFGKPKDDFEIVLTGDKKLATWCTSKYEPYITSYSNIKNPPSIIVIILRHILDRYDSLAKSTFFAPSILNERSDRILGTKRPYVKNLNDYFCTDANSLEYIQRWDLPGQNERFDANVGTISDVYYQLFGTTYKPNFLWGCGSIITVGRDRIRKTPRFRYQVMLDFLTEENRKAHDQKICNIFCERFLVQMFKDVPYGKIPVIETSKVKSEEEGSDTPVYISLTTIFQNQDILLQTLKSINKQSRKPDKIYVFLSEESYLLDEGFANREITNESLQKYIDENPLVEIQWVKNTGPYRKLLPLLKQKWHEDCIIITIDDDTFYDCDLIANLLRDYKEHHCVVGYRGFTASCDKAENFDYGHRTSPQALSKYNFLTGKGGILYKPEFFQKTKELIFDEIYLETCHTADDLWFFIVRLLNNVNCYIGDKSWSIQDNDPKIGLFQKFNGKKDCNTRMFQDTIKKLKELNYNV